MRALPEVARGAIELLAGQGAAQASSFLRNIILARILRPADFGVAAIFGITLHVVEMLSNVGAEKLLVQAEDGDEPPFQKAVQLLRAVRGLLSGLLIVLLAAPIAGIFGIPEATWGFRCLALITVIRGIHHLDVQRLQRHLRFGPTMIVDSGSSWLATIVSIPAALWLRNWAAMLVVLIAQATSSAVASHLLAERKYDWEWDRTYWRRIVHWGWPLMVNSGLMLAILEGDRIIIGAAHRFSKLGAYTMADLGRYSAAFGLTMAPTMLIANVSSSLFLPVLSRAQNHKVLFRERLTACAQASCLMAAVVSVIFIVAGDSLVTLIYGARYATSGAVVAWLGAMWAIRIVRVAPTLAAMATGDTRNAMYSNLVRSAALLGMVLAAVLAAELHWIAVAGFCGEILALAVSICLLARRNAISPRISALPALLPLGGMVLSAAVRALVGREAPAFAIVTGAVTALFVIGWAFLSFPELRREVRSLIPAWSDYHG